MVKIYKMMAGIYAANTYIVYDDETRDCVLVDCGGDEDVVLRFLEDNHLKLHSILLTHGHADHIAGVPKIKKALNCDVYIHEEDSELLTDAHKNFSVSMAMGRIEFSPDYLFKDRDSLSFGSLTFKVLHTPGHTRGSVCFDIGIGILSGDTLFKASIGRTDLYGGSEAAIINSIKTRLLIYPEDTEIYPGHGPKTTIGYEKKYNMFVR